MGVSKSSQATDLEADAASTKRQLARDFLWNTIASLFTALSTVVMLATVTRTAGVAAGGIFSLALAIGQQFQTLGMFEVRTYHITDVQHRFPFAVYFAARVITVFLMIIGIIGYCLLKENTLDAAVLIAIIALLRVFDAFEDVFYSELQRFGRLDLGGAASTVRTTVTVAAFCIPLIAGASLLTATVVTMLASTLALIGAYVPVCVGKFPLHPSWDTARILAVFRACAPLFLGSFIAMYLANSPKYAIGHYLDNTVQGVFAVLYMPAMAINLLSLFVYRPLVTRIATQWSEHDHAGFFHSIRRGLLGTAVAFILVALLCLVAGPEILQLVFGTDVSAYSVELLVLLAAGALNAASVILVYALTTMRTQRDVLASYLVAAIGTVIAIVILVPRFALMGACIAYSLSMLFLTLSLFSFLLIRMYRSR